jgi:hypothetical protein
VPTEARRAQLSGTRWRSDPAIATSLVVCGSVAA